MKTVSVVRALAAPAAAVWAIVRTGAEMDRWVPSISACRIEGAGVGAKRVCVINERELRETIETVDDATMLFQYRIHEQSLMPVHDVLGTIHVTPTPSGASVLWFVQLELDDPSAWQAVRDGITSIYTAGLDGLARLASERA